MGARLAARAAIARHRGRAEEAVRAVLEGIDRVPAPDRPTILALGARAAEEAGLPAEATGMRRRIVAEHQDVREYPEAARMGVTVQPVGVADEARIRGIDPPTDLALHPNSPGYRLILNNVLFPAAKKKKLKT